MTLEGEKVSLLFWPTRMSMVADGEVLVIVADAAAAAPGVAIAKSE